MISSQLNFLYLFIYICILYQIFYFTEFLKSIMLFPLWTTSSWCNGCVFQRICPSLVQDLFSDLRDGDRLLDLLEVMSGQHLVSVIPHLNMFANANQCKCKIFIATFVWFSPQKREKGHGVFQQRGNVETALNFLKNKSVRVWLCLCSVILNQCTFLLKIGESMNFDDVFKGIIFYYYYY